MGMPSNGGGTPSGGRSRSRMGGVVHSQPGSRSTSPTSLRSYHTYYDSQGTAGVSEQKSADQTVRYSAYLII